MKKLLIFLCIIVLLSACLDNKEQINDAAKNLYNLSIEKVKQNRPAEAIALLKNAIVKIESQNIDIDKNLYNKIYLKLISLLFEQKEYEKAIIYSKKYNELFKANDAVNYIMAESNYNRNNYIEAVKYYEGLSDEYKKTLPEYNRVMVDIYTNLKEKENALKYLKELIKDRNIVCTETKGECYLIRENKKQVLKPGMIINEKDIIETGENSYVDIDYSKNIDKGSVFRIYEKSVIILNEKYTSSGKYAREVLLDLKKGGSLVRLHKGKASKTNMKIIMPVATAGIRGTIFEVQYDANSKRGNLSVLEGKVEVKRHNDKKIYLIDKRRELEFSDRIDEQANLAAMDEQKVLELSSRIKSIDYLNVDKEFEMRNPELKNELDKKFKERTKSAIDNNSNFLQAQIYYNNGISALQQYIDEERIPEKKLIDSSKKALEGLAWLGKAENLLKSLKSTYGANAAIDDLLNKIQDIRSKIISDKINISIY